MAGFRKGDEADCFVQCGGVNPDVDLCGRDRGMAEQFLHGAEIASAVVGGSREVMTQRVARPSGSEEAGESLADVVGVAVAAEPAGESPSASCSQAIEDGGKYRMDWEEALPPPFANYEKEVGLEVVGMHGGDFGTPEPAEGSEQKHKAFPVVFCPLKGCVEDHGGCGAWPGWRDADCQQ